MRTFSFLLLLILVLTGAIANGHEGPKPLDEKAARSLIEQLASPNPKPQIIDPGKGQSHPKYAEGYDFRKQRKVFEAYEQLHKLSEDASIFPYLIEKWDDNRYSMCSEFNGFAYTHSVGYVCRDILKDRIEPYQGFTNYEARIRLPDFFQSLADKEAAAKWWNDNKRQSILQIQLGVMDWIYQEMDKDKTRYTAEDKARFKKAQQDLRTSGKAILRDSTSSRYFVEKMPNVK